MGQANWAKMMSPGGKLITLAWHPTKKVNKAVVLTYLSTKTLFPLSYNDNASNSNMWHHYCTCLGHLGQCDKKKKWTFFCHMSLSRVASQTKIANIHKQALRVSVAFWEKFKVTRKKFFKIGPMADFAEWTKIGKVIFPRECLAPWHSSELPKAKRHLAVTLSRMTLSRNTLIRMKVGANYCAELWLQNNQNNYYGDQKAFGQLSFWLMSFCWVSFWLMTFCGVSFWFNVILLSINLI